MAGDFQERGYYRRVSTRIWRDAFFRALGPIPPSPHALWFRLLTGPEHSVIPGIVMAGEFALAGALRWTMDDLRRCMKPLTEAGRIIADWEADLAFMPNAIVHNMPRSSKNVLGWRLTWAALPDSPLTGEIRARLREVLASRNHALSRAFDTFAMEQIGSSIPSKMPSSPRSMIGSYYQDQDQDQDQKKKEGNAKGGCKEPPLALAFPASPDDRPKKGKPPKGWSPELLPFRDRASKLWDRQEALRVAANRKFKRRPASEADLRRVAERLSEGRTDEDCDHVLVVYASEERRREAGARCWFDGVTNWRPNNFDRALGQPIPAWRPPLDSASKAPGSATTAPKDEKAGQAASSIQTPVNGALMRPDEADSGEPGISFGEYLQHCSPEERKALEDMGVKLPELDGAKGEP